MESISHIIKGCISKNHKYQKIIYEHFRGYALHVVLRYVYTYENAINVVNDGFIKLFNHFGQFKIGEERNDEKRLMGWLKRIMINASIDELRRSNLLREIHKMPDQIWQLQATDSYYDADQPLLFHDLLSFVKALPPAYRIVFTLYVIDGYSHSEIAHLLNMPIGTSKSNLSRAREILRTNIKNLSAYTVHQQ